jgi:hypothetical protein
MRRLEAAVKPNEEYEISRSSHVESNSTSSIVLENGTSEEKKYAREVDGHTLLSS